MRKVRADLAPLGHEVTSRWIDIPPNEGDGVAEFGTDNAAHHGNTDLEDIDAAESMILFTRRFSTTGGYFTEFGYAVGKGKLVAVVGPLRNIFMGPPRTTHFPDYETFFAVVRQDADDMKLKEQFSRARLRSRS